MKSHVKFGLFFGCLLLLMVTRVDGSTERDRCTFRFWNDASVDVECEGREEIDATYKRNSSAPINVIPGLWLFGDPLGNGQRSFVVVENTELELYDIQFTDDLSLEGLEILSPISIVNSTVWIRNCTFSSGSFPVLAGGVYMSQSRVYMRECTFSGDLSVRHRSLAGAIRLTNQSLLMVTRSRFLKVASKVSAIHSDLQSNITLSHTVFKAINAENGSAVYAEDSRVHVRKSIFSGCRSTNGNGALSLLNCRGLAIESCRFNLNNGSRGAAVYFRAPTQQINMSRHGHRPTVDISDSTFESNVAGEMGGGLYVYGANLILTKSVIADNQATRYGAGLFVVNADQVSIASCQIEDQTVKSTGAAWNKGLGAGIYAAQIGRFLSLKNEIGDNHATNSGGGARFYLIKRLQIHDSVIERNSAQDQAGISARSVKKLKMFNVTVADNRAQTFAAGLYLTESSELSMQNMRFIRNSAWAQGAVSIRSTSSINVEDSQFVQNRATYQFAAALHIDAALNVSIARSEFIQNAAKEVGAGIHAWSVDRMSIRDSSFVGNSAHSGGSCYVERSKAIQISSSNFTANEAFKGSGGSVHLDIVGRASIQDSTFSSNRAKAGGGAIAGTSMSRISCTHTDFVNNNSTMASGGGVNFKEVDNVHLKGCRLYKNSASMDGGAMSLDGIYNQIDIRDTEFTSNEATGRQESRGGAIAVGVFSRMNVVSSRFDNNRAAGNGGAVNLLTTPRELSRTVDMAWNVFKANTALHGSGGAICFEKCPHFKADHCRFESNSAFLQGGAILIKTGDWVAIFESQFEHNKLIAEAVDMPVPFFVTFGGGGDYEFFPPDSGDSPEYAGQPEEEKHGGAISLVNIKKVILDDTRLTANTAPGFGAGAYIQDVRRLIAHQNKFISNVASTSGGGLFGYQVRNIVLNHSSFIENQVRPEEPSDREEGIVEENGGGIALKDSRNIHVLQVVFTDNRASHSGGAASFSGVTNVTVRGCVLTGNSGLSGGAVHIRDSTRGAIENCQFEGNSGLGEHEEPPNALVSQRPSVNVSDADHGGHGGAIVIEHSFDFNLTSPEFRSNRASGNGGALYCTDSANVSLIDGSFVDNEAFDAGGAIALHDGNMSITANRFTGNQATNGAVLSIERSFLSGEKLQTSQNLAEDHGGVVFCEESSNVTIHGSKFVDDGSLQGSSFVADCSCYLSVTASKIVCSNADVNGCGSVASDEHCNGNIRLETANVIHYLKLWSIIALIIPAVVVLPFTVIMANVCARLSIKMMSKSDWNKGATDDALEEDPEQCRRFLDDAPEHSLTDISIDNSISFEDSPFQTLTEKPPVGEIVEQLDTPRSHHLTGPTEEADDTKIEPSKPIDQKPQLFAIRSKPSSAFNGPPFMHPAIDPFYTIESPGPHRSQFLGDRPDRSTDHVPHDQHDFRAEYEEMEDMRSCLFSFRSSLDWQE